MTSDPDAALISHALTPSRAAVLLGVSEGNTTSADLRFIAPPASCSKWEWAGPHLRWLREAGLVEHDGRIILGAKAHQLTPLGSRVAMVLRERHGRIFSARPSPT